MTAQPISTPVHAPAKRRSAALTSRSGPIEATCREDDRPDHFGLYRWAVQDPETHAELLRIMYLCMNPGRSPVVLREDFAGTAADSVAWVALREGRQALAVEIDPSTAEWARGRADRMLGERAASIDIIAGDVMEVGPPNAPAADILSVLNFSVFYLHTREDLRAYLRHARESLAPGGLLALNLFGGTQASQALARRRHIAPAPRLSSEKAIAPFDYLWEQWPHETRPGLIDCRIHFELPIPGGSGETREIRDAFRYEWRVWSAPELMAALEEAGFGSVEMWRHTYEPEKGPESLFLGPVPLSEVESLDYWTAYILALRTD